MEGKDTGQRRGWRPEKEGWSVSMGDERLDRW